MKRLLVLLALVGGLFAFSACHYDIDLSVDASAEILFSDGTMIRVDGASPYGGFHQRSLSDSDLEWIFLDLTKPVNLDSFSSGVLYLQLYDEIGGKHLCDETYGVVYNSRAGHYEFADLDARY